MERAERLAHLRPVVDREDEAPADRRQLLAQSIEVAAAEGYTPPTPEEQAATARIMGIELWSRRLAVGQFGGSPFDGRIAWPDRWRDNTIRKAIDGISGWLVQVDVFVTDEQVTAQIPAAQERYDKELAEAAQREAAKKAKKEAAERRLTDLQAMPPPAVVVVDGAAWTRSDDGSFVSTADEGEAYADWDDLLGSVDVDDIGDTFVTTADFDAAMTKANAS